MNEDELAEDALDPDLRRLFAEARRELPGEAYTDRVMAALDKRRSRAIVVGAGLGGLLALVAVPAHDLALLVAQLVLVPLVEVDRSFLSEVLAPINSVGALLSALLVAMRVAHRRLFA